MKIATFLRRLMVGLAAAGAIGVLGWSMVAASWECHGENSRCVSRAEKDIVYEGTLTKTDGTPLSHYRFYMGLTSRGAVPLTTDGQGRFCLLWAREPNPPSPEDRQKPPHVPQALRASGPHTREGQPIPVASAEAATPLDECTRPTVSIPWYQAQNLTSSWQFIVPLVIALVALAAMVAGYAQRGSRRHMFLRVGSAAAALSIFMAIAVRL